MDATQLPGVDMVSRSPTLAEVTDAIAAVPDPEIPVITIADLGILRDVTVEAGTIVVTITPTYSGCPAMTQIAKDIRTAGAPFGQVRVEVTHHPPWTTDWMTDHGKRALREYAIAPPPAVGATETVECPRCRSEETATVSHFGSTACKALMRCRSCGEPFDLFKAL